MASLDESLQTETIESIQDELLTWYVDNHRTLPWRADATPYHILVSEVMSQQTQLDRIIEPFERFIDRWPTFESLAEASQADVLGFWSTHALGYNNRAKYLHETATNVVADYGGSLPEEPAELQTLPGIGPYTAHAVASFAFDRNVGVVDTNVKRIVYRVLERSAGTNSIPYQSIANALVPPGRSAQWNNAMMELGALVCGKSPECDTSPCPIRQHCSAYQTGDFRAPDVPEQPSFDGSRRQYRGKIVRLITETGPLTEQELRKTISPTPNSTDSDWLIGIIDDLVDEGLLQWTDAGGEDLLQLHE